MASAKQVQYTISDPKNAEACGLAIIVANSYGRFSPLNGTHRDAENMEKAFTTLKFAIHKELDIPKDRVEKLADKAAECTYSSTYRCIAFVFSGHGHNEDPNKEDTSHRNYIMGEDWKAISTKVIIQKFYPKNVPKIAKIPKLFFFDACRGGEAMEAVPVAKGAESMPLKYPPEGNFLVAYSNMPDYKSYELMGRGGIWMSEVAKLLPSSNLPVESVLTQVRGKLNALFQRKTLEGYIQQPESLNRLNVVIKLRELAGLGPATTNSPEYSDIPDGGGDSRGVDPPALELGAVVEADSITESVLNHALTKIQDAPRKIAIGICNKTGQEFCGGQIAFRNGTSDTLFPPSLPNGLGVIYGARKLVNYYRYGVMGVITYQLDDGQTKLTLAIMFTVPFLLSFWGTWWAARVYDGERKASRKLYDELRIDDKRWMHRGDGNWYDGEIGYGFRATGAMTQSGTSVFHVKVSREVEQK